jgi:hypothetical protein
MHSQLNLIAAHQHAAELAGAAERAREAERARGVREGRAGADRGRGRRLIAVVLFRRRSTRAQAADATEALARPDAMTT